MRVARGFAWQIMRDKRNDIGTIWRITAVAMTALCMFLLSGCSKAKLNNQIAEAIGTTGMYENNEPVETPKMKAEQQLQKIEEEKENALLATLGDAQEYIDSMDYEKAMETLNSVPEENEKDIRVIEAKVECQKGQSEMEVYTGPIPHIFFHSLIADTERAFDGDAMEEGYNYWMTTTEEFEAMLESMYEKGYVLINIHELVEEVVDKETGKVTFVQNYPSVPKGKIPFVLSLDDINYYDYMKNDGFAQRLVLDENGDVKNLYIDADGNELIGNYDAIPILDEFVRQHPDFSLRGAKGIVGETGWEIASHSYGHDDFAIIDENRTLEDIQQWKAEVESLVGETDIFIYPYGSEVEYPSEKLELLREAGFQYFCGVWGTNEFLSIEGDYMRQSRRNFDGYNLYHNAEYQKEFFDPAAILDPSRPAFT